MEEPNQKKLASATRRVDRSLGPVPPKALRSCEYRRDAGIRADVGALFGSIGCLAACYAILALRRDWATSEYLAFGLIAGLVVITICVPRLFSVTRRIRKLTKLRRLFAAIAQCRYDEEWESERWAAIEGLRRVAEPLPGWAVQRLSRLYRALVAHIVGSMRLTDTEFARLRRTAEAFGLVNGMESSARTNGFLDAFQLAVGNRMQEFEERQFNQIRIGLDIDASVIAPVREHETELIEARRIAYACLDSIPSPVRLRTGEACYHQAVAASVMRARSGDTNEQDGGVVPDAFVQIGDLLITNIRILFKSVVAIVLDHETIVSVDVDARNSLVILTTDALEETLAFRVDKPFVVRAFIDRFGYRPGAR